MTVEAFEPILLLTMGDHATDNEIVPVTIVRTIFVTMDNGQWGGSAFAVHRQIRGEKCIPLHSDAQCGLATAGRSVVASAPALGAGDREFESPRPDHLCRFLVAAQRLKLTKIPNLKTWSAT